MSTIYNDYKPYQYGISGMGKAATDFYPLEKVSKIAYRVIDLAHIFTEYPCAPLASLSSQIKDLVLFIESTRFPCVSFPLFFRDEKGVSFFQKKPWLQCAERISITAHLALKTLFGADRTGLIRLGIIGTYAIGNMTAFRWIVEGTVWFYNFFGTWEGSVALIKARAELEKIHSASCPGTNRNWTVIKNDLLFDEAKAQLKIAAKISKLILITFAVSMAALNITTVLCQVTILSLAALSDGFALAGFYHGEYCGP